jgi:hypothetical protein
LFLSRINQSGTPVAAFQVVLQQKIRRAPGYTTTDDFGTDGNDTPHSSIPQYKLPNYVQANASFPTDGSDTKTVDFVFVDFIEEKYVIPALSTAKGSSGTGMSYSIGDVKLYMPDGFTSRDYFAAYARRF